MSYKIEENRNQKLFIRFTKKTKIQLLFVRIKKIETKINNFKTNRVD